MNNLPTTETDFDQNLNRLDSILQGLGQATGVKVGDVESGVFGSTNSNNGIEFGVNPTTKNSYIQSRNFATGSTGWQIKNDGTAEFQSVEIRGVLDNDNLNWSTFFESLDGFSKRPNGGTIAFRDLSPPAGEQIIGVILTTAATSGDALQFIKNMAGLNRLTFNSDMRFRADIMLHNNTNQTGYITCGSLGTSKHFGFKIVDNEIFGSCADGTTQSLTSAMTTFSAFTSSSVKFEARLKVADSIEFTVIDKDGNESTASLSTNLPTGTLENIMEVYLQPNENSAKVMTIQYWDFWNSI